MSGIVDGITGRGARKQAALAEQAQATQAAGIAAERARVSAVEEGQRKAASGGGGGLLAFVDEKKLKTTLG